MNICGIGFQPMKSFVQRLEADATLSGRLKSTKFSREEAG
jgi:hypothetical protein